MVENWAVYHFWSIASQRHEMAVLELYDATPRDMSVAHVLFANDNATQSAFVPPPLEVWLPSLIAAWGSHARSSEVRLLLWRKPKHKQCHHMTGQHKQLQHQLWRVHNAHPPA